MSEPKTLAQLLDERWRDDDQSLAWHVQAIPAMWNAIQAAGLAKQARDLTVSSGPPATTKQIAAYQALVPQPLPPELVEAWRKLGSASFTTPTHVYRWLAPSELVTRRAELRGLVRKSLRKHRPEIDVLATLDDRPLLMFDPDQSSTDRWYHHASGEIYQRLAWLFAVHINLVLLRELTSRIGDVFLLRVGQRPGPKTQRVRLHTAKRYWEAIVDDRQLLTRAATLGNTGKPSVKLLPTSEAAATLFAKAVAGAKAKGYR